eukprot:CAMPEP_0197536540 /NCGR_PEP_ID=MMETSP1318-20131121/54151_1 /TAXON_ID=552666 /ORGANISM="Partenskyella glossopodia, Strain RCC365" /LENGTH=210 /DNA_ID=CAMNT_0043094457 /DNA_START=204 /DNA_END=836 /DNA_ORIENTATION=-
MGSTTAYNARNSQAHAQATTVNSSAIAAHATLIRDQSAVNGPYKLPEKGKTTKIAVLQWEFDASDKTEIQEKYCDHMLLQGGVWLDKTAEGKKIHRQYGRQCAGHDWINPAYPFMDVKQVEKHVCEILETAACPDGKLPGEISKNFGYVIGKDKMLTIYVVIAPDYVFSAHGLMTGHTFTSAEVEIKEILHEKKDIFHAIHTDMKAKFED